MTSPSLPNEIEAAFSGVSYPGNDRLTVYDKSGREYDDTYQLLRGRTWQDLSVVEFMRGDTPIPDLSPEAFHYYMPALLLASLDESVAADVSDSLAFFLSPSSAKQTDGDFPYDDTENYNRRMAMFTEDQRNVIIRVLREYVDREWEDDATVQPTIEFLQR